MDAMLFEMERAASAEGLGLYDYLKKQGI